MLNQTYFRVYNLDPITYQYKPIGIKEDNKNLFTDLVLYPCTMFAVNVRDDLISKGYSKDITVERVKE